MAKRQCECGSFLYYIYNHKNERITIICIREENEGPTNHRAIINEKEVLNNE